MKRSTLLAWHTALIVVALVALGALLAPADADHKFGPSARWPLTVTVETARVTIREAQEAGTLWNVGTGQTHFWVLGGTGGQVRIVDGAITRMGVTDITGGNDLGKPYRTCWVWISEQHAHNVAVLVHEFGHCLGFADHIWKSVDDGRHWNPAICDDPSDPRYSDYSGVMSYCDWPTNPTVQDRP